MPSTLKIAYFMGCSCLTAISVALLGAGMSQSWAQTTLECDRGNKTFDGQAVITWDLFSALFQRRLCPLLGTQSTIGVFSELKDSGAPVALYAIVVLFLVVCMICSALSILIALYNSVSNPYETYMGPVGIYVCNSIGACLSTLVLIIYVLMINVTNIAETVVLNDAGNLQVEMKKSEAKVLLGYFLVIPYPVLSLGAIAVVYFYDHAAYTQRKEQQRPTEDAPKEIMMY